MPSTIIERQQNPSNNNELSNLQVTMNDPSETHMQGRNLSSKGVLQWRF